MSGLPNFTLNDEDVICFSILITGKCNINCTYCHYYAYQDRASVNYNLSRGNLEAYINVINHVKNNYHGNIQIRFSGGEPLMAGDLLYTYSELVYNSTGIKPFVLSNGKAITQDVVHRSKKSNIQGYVVSLENPFHVDSGSVETEKIVDIIRKYNSPELPIIPGVVIVNNDQFKNLELICDYFYERLGQIPSFLNLDFSYFRAANQVELSELKKNIFEVLKKYFSKVPLSLFSYVVPELSSGFNPFYIVEFDLNNSHEYSGTNFDQDISTLDKALNEAYFKFYCPEINCDWHSTCRRLKWVWETDIKGYCEVKKNISTAYYDFLIAD